MTWAVKQYTVKPGSNRSLTLCLSRGRDEPRAPGYDNWCACVTSSFTALVCKLYGLLFLTVRSVGMVDPHLPSAKVSAGAEQRTSDRRDNISHTYEVRRESQAMIERITYDVYGPTPDRTSPRLHRVVTQTSGVVVSTHRTLGRRGGTQTAWRKKAKK